MSNSLLLFIKIIQFMRRLLFCFCLLSSYFSQAQTPFFFEDARERYQTVKVDDKILAAFRADGSEYLRIDEQRYLYRDAEKTGIYELSEASVNVAYIQSDGAGLDTRMVQKSFKALTPVGSWYFLEEGERSYPRESAPPLADSLLAAKGADELIYYKQYILKIRVGEARYYRLDDSSFFYYHPQKGEGRYRLTHQIDTFYDINAFSGKEEIDIYRVWQRVGPWFEKKVEDSVTLTQMGHYRAGERRGFWRHSVGDDFKRDTLWFYNGEGRQHIPSTDKFYEADSLEMALPGRWWFWESYGDLQGVRSQKPPAFAQYEWEIDAHGQSRIRRIGSNNWQRVRWKIWQERAGLLELRLQHDYLGNSYQNFWLQEKVMWWYGDKKAFLSLILN